MGEELTKCPSCGSRLVEEPNQAAAYDPGTPNEERSGRYVCSNLDCDYRQDVDEETQPDVEAPLTRDEHKR